MIVSRKKQRAQQQPKSQPSGRDKFFKGQQDNEEFICFMRHHWIVLIREFLYFAIFLTLIILMLANLNEIMNLLALGEFGLLFATIFLLMTLFLHHFYLKIFNFFINVGIITNMRFIDHQKSLFFHDTMDSIDMAQIQNVERLGEGILPSIFRYGDLKIFLTASSGVKTFSHIPNVHFHFRCLNRTREERQHELLRERSAYMYPALQQAAAATQTPAQPAQPTQATQPTQPAQPAAQTQPAQQTTQSSAQPNVQAQGPQRKQVPPVKRQAAPIQKNQLKT